VQAEADYDCFATSGTAVEKQGVRVCLVAAGFFFLKDLLPIRNVAESERYWNLQEQAYAGEGVGCQAGKA
jgi:hypothetical protein